LRRNLTLVPNQLNSISTPLKCANLIASHPPLNPPPPRLHAHAHARAGCILADDMGLGKTLQAITLLWTLLKQVRWRRTAGAMHGGCTGVYWGCIGGVTESEYCASDCLSCCEGGSEEQLKTTHRQHPTASITHHY